jgi:predicted ATPase/signal transduction histidine kinase/ActR/RegA family two-component response regulator/tRNA A-37 threonylcarbamoyl transferase component Bud32
LKNNHNFGQQIAVCIFLVSLVLQSCSNLANLPIPKEKGQTDNAKVSFEEQTNTKFIKKEELVVAFCKQEGQLQAEVQEKPPEGFSKTPALPIYAADGMDLTQAASSKEEQKQLIHVDLSRGQRSGYVYVANLGLMREGKDGDEKSKKQEKSKAKEVEKKPIVVKQRRIEEKGKERLIKEEEVVSLNEERKKQLHHVDLLKEEQPGYVYVGNTGLKGGGGNTKGSSMISLPGYKLLNCLYEGASSLIYRAVRLSDERPVVIKVSAQKALTEKEAQPFRREFELGQQINSPHVVRYLELQQDLTYGIALVMEDDLAVELTTVMPLQGFSNHEFLEIAIQIVEGLQAIHAANIIHNDLKPSNILIQSATHTIKIIDFSCSSALRQTMQSITPMMAGTLAYISPEQTGRVNRSVDYRTDLYSLGVTFYRLLCGQLPFTADDALGLIHQHLAKQPLLPHKIKPTIALPLSQMVMKLLEKEAENRYQSCEGILYDLTYCLSALNETSTIPEFKLGQQDFSSKLTLSQHLYGRENEINVLINTFERISEGQREALMVAGQPGIGKTLLIQEIQKSIALKNGYFLTGKFDLLNKNVAYSALIQAFNGLIKQWLTEDENRIAHWKTEIQVALDPQAPFLTKVIPALTLLIGEQPEANIADISQAKNVLNWVFQEFIKVCASSAHPLVIFLDDLQWADQASLELMTYLMQQPNIGHLLWIGAYRDTDVTASHPAMQAIMTLQAASITVQTLTLAPLALESLCQWIADSLHKPFTDIQPLVELIYQKTAGNPFFVKLFLQSLYDQQLLTFSPKLHWQWDLDKIRQHPATENVITLMSYQIQQLPDVTQKALSLASCLGHRLKLSTLQTAMNRSPAAVDEALQPALNSGILIQTDSEVQFSHDRVQEAAYRLLSDVEKAHMHLMVGRRLLAHFSTEDAGLFDIVAQFNRCPSLVTDSQERLQIALLNLKAGQKAKQATAYMPALNYLYVCRDWIDTETLWQTNYSLAFTFYKELVETEYLSGHMEISQALIADIQPRLQSIFEKVDIYHLLIIQKTLQGHYQEAISIGNNVLQLLGSGLPLDDLDKLTEFIQKTADELKQKLQDIPISSLLDAPLAVEPEKQVIIKVLEGMISASYQSGLKIYLATTLLSVKMSLTYGNAPGSSQGYAMYGALLCSKFKEYALGYQFGCLAVQLAEKLQSLVQHCQSSMIMLGFIHPWSKSIQQLPNLLTATYEECQKRGQLEYAGYCGHEKAQMLFYQGIPLAKVQQDALPLLQFTHNTKNQIAIKTIQAIQLMLANLMGDTPDEWNFDANAINEAKFEEGCQQANSFYALCLYQILKAEAFYLYGHFEQAFDNLALAKKYLVFIVGQYTTAIFNWYDSLTRLALYPHLSHEEQQAYLQQVIQNQQQMQLWQASCAENFAHKYHLVEAELARIKGDYAQAEEHYDQAVELADRHGFIQEWALAAELTAKYWLARGKSLCAQGYLNTAFNGYKRWGAKRKLLQLKAKYADLLYALAPPNLSPLNINQETTLSDNTLKFLDLSSILKASHAISSEIELPKFLHSMMQIIVENAGAQQGTLFFVEADDTIFVQAEYAIDGTITTLQKIPLDNWDKGAQMVIQYVKKEHQCVVVDNATTHEPFKTDPYIRQTQVKSILCIPLLKHTELKAILYLENNLLSHAFTPERVQTVLILTAPVTISLENARSVAEQIELTRQLAEQSARTQMAEESLHAVTHDLQLALQASKAGTWNLWIDSQKVTCDESYCALFGLKPEEFGGTYKAVMERIHPEDREQVNEAVKHCIEQDIPYDMEPRVIWPDGSQHVISSQGRVYRDYLGQPVKIAGVCLEVTQRRQLEQERLEALKHAEEERIHRQEALNYQQRQKEYTETVCHELRNPLQGLIGSTELLKTDMGRLSTDLTAYQQMQTPESKMQLDARMEDCKNYVANMEECIDHLKALLDDVLNLAKLEANKMELAIKIVQPKALIQSVAKMFAAKIAQKQLQLNLQLPEEDILVKGDAQRLKQIIINLLANALKFTEKGGITLGLKVLQITATSIRLQFMVADTGIGMTPEERSRLFQRFSQANVHVASQYDGTGLGLEISDKLVKLMNGQIEVISEKGEGTQFNFVIECVTPTLEELNTLAKQPEASTVSATLPTVGPQARKILLADDNLINQKVLTKVLKDLGYTALQIANHGKEAVQCFTEAGPFDLIFMDIEMPVMNGYEASQQIRQQEHVLKLASTPIIGLTGHTEEKYKQQALAAGMNDVLSKPFTKDDIQHLVATWLEPSQIIREQGYVALAEAN